MSKAVGLAIAAKAKAAGIDAVKFDCGGFLYHGSKSIVQLARERGCNLIWKMKAKDLMGLG